MKLESSQIKSKFYKLMKKFYEHYSKEKLMKEVSSRFAQAREVTMNPHNISVNDNLNDGANEEYNKSMEDESVGWKDNSTGSKGSEFEENNSQYSKQTSSPVKVLRTKRKYTCSSINTYMS